MKKNNQKIVGSNNFVIGEHHGNINIINPNANPQINIIHNPTTHISEEQAYEIKRRVTELVDMLVYGSEESKSKIFNEVYGKLKKRFKVTTYKLIPKEQYDNAIKWLSRYKGGKGRKSLKEGNTQLWRKETYRSIYSRGRERGISKDSIMVIATQVLKKDTMVSSLKDLTEKELEILYNYFFAS